MDTEKGIKLPKAVQLVIADQTYVYAISRKNHKYGFIGGMVETGENCFEALQREVKEEIGFNVDFNEVILITQKIFDGKEQYAYALLPKGYQKFLKTNLTIEKNRSLEIFGRENYISNRSQYVIYDLEVLGKFDHLILYKNLGMKEWYKIILSKRPVQTKSLNNYKIDGTAQHYDDHLIISIEKMELIYGTIGAIAFCECTILKYKDRLGKKEGAEISEDIMKMGWYEKKSKELQDKLGLPGEIKSYYFDNKIAELKLKNFTNHGTNKNE